MIPAKSAQLYAEQKSKSVYVRSIIVAASDLSLSWAEEESRRFMSATDSAGFRLRLLRITTRPEDARMMSGGIDATDSGLETRLEEYRRIRQSVGRIAELTVTQKGAVLRYRDPRALPQRILLRGNDPLLGSLNSVDFEILYVAVRQEPRLRIFGSRGSLRADTYIRIQEPLTEALGGLLHERMTADFDAPMSFMHLRNDEYFAGDFPTAFPFSILENPPNKARSPTLICNAWNDSRVSNCGLIP
ncbi:MAG: hypothetical protein U0Q18_19745 [Bryobacteraceae bacterium]